MLFLLSLIGSAAAQLPAACTEGEFLANGRFTGQNIDMNYDASGILTAGGNTQLKVDFFVPRRYTETYEANSFAITFNRNQAADAAGSAYGDFRDQVAINVDQGTADQSACYSNRYDNYTYCADGGSLWSLSQNAENECITDATATIPWEDVMGDAFSSRSVIDNGGYTEIYLLATVETWTHFVETASANYQGQMTGSEGWLNTDVTDGDTNRQGTYNGDGGWAGVGDDHSGDFGVLTLDDERYTLYQIPFVLRFPKTVVVETSFVAASQITVLTAVLGQDVIQVDMNPGAGNFATLETVLSTEVQSPYSIASPDAPAAAMRAYVGSDQNGGGTHAESIEFIEYTDGGNCGGVGVCRQDFKVRITPTADNPCSVAGEYFFEFWAQCQHGGEGGANGCGIDDLAEDADMENARTSNAYFSKTVTIAHQPFCPVLMDEVRVVGDLRVFHDETFMTEIANDSVFTNDVLFYEAEYRTASASASNDFAGLENNDFDGDVVGDDSIIDYVRSTKIFMDVTIGKNSAGEATEGWNGSDWNANFDFELGGTRIPDTDITGNDITVTQPSGDAAKYNIVLCNVEPMPAAEIMFSDTKSDDCFTNKRTIAVDFLDFNQVTVAKSGGTNSIDENEVAFEMRMDERIIPLKPANDNSHVTVTVEAEVYYKGNRHATRRLLQVDQNTRSQSLSMSTQYGIQKKQDLNICTVDPKLRAGSMTVTLTFENESDMPSTAAALDWSSRFSMQLDNYLKTRGLVSVKTVRKCSEEECKTIVSDLRRLEGQATDLEVELAITSTKTTAAGVAINALQNHLVDSRSTIYEEVAAFTNAEVVNMEVEGCNVAADMLPGQAAEEIKSMELEDESSARALSSTLLVFLGIFWSLL